MAPGGRRGGEARRPSAQPCASRFALFPSQPHLPLRLKKRITPADLRRGDKPDVADWQLIPPTAMSRLTDVTERQGKLSPSVVRRRTSAVTSTSPRLTGAPPSPSARTSDSRRNCFFYPTADSYGIKLMSHPCPQTRDIWLCRSLSSNRPYKEILEPDADNGTHRWETHTPTKENQNGSNPLSLLPFF